MNFFDDFGASTRSAGSTAGSSTDRRSGAAGSSTDRSSGGAGSSTDRSSGAAGSSTDRSSGGAGSSTDGGADESTVDTVLKKALLTLGLLEESDCESDFIDLIEDGGERKDAADALVPGDLLPSGEEIREIIREIHAEEDAVAQREASMASADGDVAAEALAEAEAVDAEVGEVGVACDSEGTFVKPWWQDVVEERSKTWIYKVGSSGRECGRLHSVNADSLKATCRQHTGCVCWLRSATGQQDLLKPNLMEWLAWGYFESFADHQKRSNELKLFHGMKPRKGRPAGD